MSGLHHRKPGVVGAVFDDERVNAELICDGHHLHPAVLRTAFRLLGDRAVVVSDSMRANGMAEGESFDLGGQMVTVRGGLATLEDGTIAGSVTNLHQEVKNLVSYGVPFEQAVKAATPHPRPRPSAWRGRSAASSPASGPTWWCWTRTWRSWRCTTRIEPERKKAAWQESPAGRFFAGCYLK